MKISRDKDLCYCFNVFDKDSAHPFSADFRGRIRAIKSAIFAGDNKPFGIGLWLNEEKLRAFTSESAIRNLRELLVAENFYVFTLNAFPYSSFHGSPVKENVYLPDWRSEERLEYSMASADLLSRILPEETEGSISTVPGGYKKFISKRDFAKIASNILRMNEHLKRIFSNTGKKIRLAIEFEPDCVWEKAEDFVEFRAKYLSSLNELGNFIGVCYDCSHAEVVGANLDADIKLLGTANTDIVKFQISAALSAYLPDAKFALAKFADNIYLHQTSLLRDGEIVRRYPDLPELLAQDETGEIVSHYHLPIFFESDASNIIHTKKNILARLLELANNDLIQCQHLEIETYTYSVLPKDIFNASIDEMIIREYSYLIKKIQLST